MELTTALLAPYIGGQLEAQNPSAAYIYRGEIATIEVQNEGTNGAELVVTLSWQAKGEGYPPFPNRWVRSDHLTYQTSLRLISASNIGPGSEGGGDRLCLMLSFIGETTVLFPANGSKLDPAKIEEPDAVEA